MHRYVEAQQLYFGKCTPHQRASVVIDNAVLDPRAWSEFGSSTGVKNTRAGTLVDASESRQRRTFRAAELLSGHDSDHRHRSGLLGR